LAPLVEDGGEEGMDAAKENWETALLNFFEEMNYDFEGLSAICVAHRSYEDVVGEDTGR